MRDDYFLDREGNPLGGKVPLQVRAFGGGDHELVRAEANGLLHAFLSNIRQSIAPNHRRLVDLPGGGYMAMTSLWGQVSVDIYMPPPAADGGPFYGGILINPHVITGDEAMHLAGGGNFFPWRVPDAIKTAGDAPGRPAVPGTGEASTEWLVVQIARDLPLTGDPLASGAVRMFRIANPRFGGFCEVAEPGRYAASTIDGSAFFLCGQQLDHVPPMPSGLPALTRSSEAGGGPSPSRIRTVGMQPASFTEAHAAEGIIIFALVNQLWALNTRERTDSAPAPWRLLAEVSTPRPYPDDYLPNEFGATFTAESSGGELVLTCSGSNATGACSGFVVRIAPGAISGELSLVDSGFRKGAPDQQTVNFNGTYSRPSPDIEVDAWEMGVPAVDSANYGATIHATAGLASLRHVAYKALGMQETHTLDVDIVGPTPAIVPDPLILGTMPRRPGIYSRTFREYGDTRCSFVGMPFRLKGYMKDNVVRTSDSTSTPISTTLPANHHVGQAYLDHWQSPSYSDVAGIVSSPSAGDPMWLSPTEFVSFYVDAYAEWTVLECNDPDDLVEFRESVAGEYNPAGTIGQPWTERVMGALYVNTKEVNDRVYQWFDLQSATQFVRHHERRDGPHFSQPRYLADKDFDNRRAFPGIIPFQATEAVSFYTPTDLPAHDGPPPYPAVTINYNPGTTRDELQFWFPFWSVYETVVDSGGTPLGGGVVANFEGELICRYPKRAAVFEPSETCEVTDAYVGSLLGRSFTTTRTRAGGQLVANEYLAHLLPTNVAGFPLGEEPETDIVEDRQAAASASYARDPYLRYAYTARDWHCTTMGWRRDAGRTGSWSITDRPLVRFANNYERALLNETADRVECSHTLYRAGGDIVMTFEDLMALYPSRFVHTSVTVTSSIANVAAPYLQHDLLYLDKRFPELDDCDQISVFGLGDDYDFEAGEDFYFDTECIPRMPWLFAGPYRAGWTPNRPQLLVAYWGRDAAGGERDPLFPVPGYWIPNPEEDPPPGEEYVHQPHITEASETNYNLARDGGPPPDFTHGLFLGGQRNVEFYELKARAALGDIGSSFDVLYVDNRTGGFITQVKWGGDAGRIVETYIGNRTGVVPFRPIFDAWIAKGGGPPADGTKVTIVRPSVGLLDGGYTPPPGSPNPQPVSLL